MIRTTFVALVFAIASSGCISLNFEDSLTAEPIATEAETSTDSSPSERPTPPLAPTNPTFISPAPPAPDGAAQGPFAPARRASPEERELGWSDLTRLAREHQTRSELDEADRRLEQASILTSGLRTTHAARRAVFGIRARFAESLAAAGKIDRADVLADQLLAEAEAEPGLADTALVSLARSVAERRTKAARIRAQEEAPDRIPDHVSQTRVLSIALRVAQSGRASRDRIQLAFHVSQEAYWDSDLTSARNAIDQAIADIRIISPTETRDLASLKLHRAHVAIAQNDLSQAIEDATQALRLFEEAEASSAQRGRSEATLARALAIQGDTDQAIVMARGAYMRLTDDEPIDPHSRRQIVSALARAEASLGNRGQAQRYYDEALEIPRQPFHADRYLMDELQLERAAALSAPSS